MLCFLYLARDVVADVDLFVVQQHAINTLDGSLSRIGGFVMNETIALRATMLVSGNLARQDIPEGGESIMEGLL